MSIPTEIRDVCRSHFGVYVGGGKWSQPNRCDACPLREPCNVWGAAPVHTDEQGIEARDAFVAAAMPIVQAVRS